jgi:hypothetical protein
MTNRSLDHVAKTMSTGVNRKHATVPPLHNRSRVKLVEVELVVVDERKIVVLSPRMTNATYQEPVANDGNLDCKSQIYNHIDEPDAYVLCSSSFLSLFGRWTNPSTVMKCMKYVFIAICMKCIKNKLMVSS